MDTMLRKNEKRATPTIICLIAFVLASFAVSESCAGDVIHKDRKSVRIESERISVIAERLSRLFDLPVCAEETSEEQGNQEPEDSQRTRKCLDLTNATLDETLNAFVREYPKYFWLSGSDLYFIFYIDRGVESM